MSCADAKNSYGWISVSLHWLSGAIVIALWFTGDAVQGASYEELVRLRTIHVSIALTACLLIFARILWRLLKGYPEISGQSRFAHISAKFVHYLMFLSLLVMLISGPLVIAGTGQEFYLLGMEVVLLPSEQMQRIGVIARFAHGFFAHLLGVLLIIHVSAAFKHMMFNDDDTFIRIIMPLKAKE